MSTANATASDFQRNPFWSFTFEAAEKSPEATVLRIIDSDGQERVPLTFSALRDGSIAASSLLHDLGVTQGSIVFTALANTEASVALSIGVARLGGIWAPADPDLSLEQTTHLLQVYQPTVAFLSDDRAEAISQLDWMNLLATQLLKAPSWQDISSRVGQDAPPEGSAGDMDAALMLLTSGTTGMPKSVMTTNHQLREVVGWKALGDMANTAEACLIYFGSPAWISYTILFLSALSSTSSMVMGQCYSKDLYFDAVLRRKPSMLFFWPEVVVDFATLPGGVQEAVASFAKTLVYAGARTPPAALLKLIRALPNTSISQGYGCTECVKLSVLGPEEHAAVLNNPEDAVALRRLETAGQCIAEVRVVDEEDCPVPRGTTGRIQVFPEQGSAFKGYYKNPEATAAKFTSDGWLIIGDLGHLDEDSYLHVDGRDSETIVLLSGDNVYPNEVEGAIAELPGVIEVAVAKVVVGEAIHEVGAFVRVEAASALSIGDVQRKCCEKLGQSWTHPTHIFIQKEKLPRNKNGKCLKAVLTAQASASLKCPAKGQARATGGQGGA